MSAFDSLLSLDIDEQSRPEVDAAKVTVMGVDGLKWIERATVCYLIGNLLADSINFSFDEHNWSHIPTLIKLLTPYAQRGYFKTTDAL